MSLHEKVLKIYEMLPYGARGLTAQKLDCAEFYVKQQIIRITTPEEQLLNIVDKMIEATSEVVIKVTEDETKMKGLAAKLVAAQTVEN